jgi:HNH/ENDO VII superfamily nuclease with conserved GHE residues
LGEQAIEAIIDSVVGAMSSDGSSSQASSSDESSSEAGGMCPSPDKKKRAKFRKSTIADSWNDAQDGSQTGTKACPDCGNDVTVAPGEGPRDWDIDHQPKLKDRDWTGLTRPEQLDDFNTGTRLRCPGCNRSDN